MEQVFESKESKSIGICLGSTTLTIVELLKKDNKLTIENIIIKQHEGDPKSVLSLFLKENNLDGKYLGVTGRKFRHFTNIPSITEPEATEFAYQFINRNKTSFDAIVSAGGETFIVYEIDSHGKIKRISSGNKCASGTGEFFLQQIRRMNIGLKEAVELSKTSTKPHALSGRCSVFCKSDCTHALNKGESIADVAAGLAKMIANKIKELLLKIGSKKILLVGGAAQNNVVVDFVRKDFEFVEVPKEAPYFEALGAALWALNVKQDKIPENKDLYKGKEFSFDFLKPIKDFTHFVSYKEMNIEKAVAGDECIIGLDVGSTTTKAVLLRRSDKKMVASIYLRTNGNPVFASRECYSALLKELDNTKIKITGVGVTGSGRYISGLHADTDGIINEIIAHAEAAGFFDPEVDTIFEIGGQDAKYTFLTNKVASDYAMNEACSAGTGSFLEESAYESLGVKMHDIEKIAFQSKNPPNFSDQCAAFISSDIKTAFQEGLSREDIIAGLVYSICINYVNRVKGFRQSGKKIFMQGGVCYNKAIPAAMAALTGKHIIVPPHPGLMGAFGVALEIDNMLKNGQLQEKEYDLSELSSREVTYGKSFICRGVSEKCDRKCEVSMIEVSGKRLPFGGACNKYYNLKHNLKFNIDKLNHITKRKEFVFESFTTSRSDIKEDAITVGINKSFQTHSLYPLFFNFFNELGCRALLSDKPDENAIAMGYTSFCLSGQIALGAFKNLLDKKPDYIFMPQIMEMNVSKQNEYRKEYQTVCMFIQGEPFYQKATFLKNNSGSPKMLTPALNFMSGFESEEKTFVDIAVKLGFTKHDGKDAFRKAVEKQKLCFAAMKEEGRRILTELEKDPSRTAVVLFGRPYNAFTEEANKGLPFKFASRGIEIIPYDFLEYELEENYKGTYWEMGQRIIKAGKIVKRHPQLFGCYLTNFLCALDSIMVQHFRDLMEEKPSLTIEVDEHTADAGVNTRIEAFSDVVKNYLSVKNKLVKETETFNKAEIKIDKKGKVYFIDSNGDKFLFTDKKVKVIVPSMGDLFNRGAASAIRHMGWNAEALPVCDREALDLGRSITTNKECLPIINIIGELLKYLKYRKESSEKLAVFCVSAGGCCRVGQYKILLDRTIEKLKLKNVAVITLENDSSYAGFGIQFRLDALKTIHAADVMDDIRSAIKALALDKNEGMKIFEREFDKIIRAIDRSNKKSFYTQLKESAKELSKIKLLKPVSEAKYIGVVGEIFVRRDHFSLLGIPEKLAQNGFVMLDAPVMEWIKYTDFLRKIKMFQTKTTMLGKLENFISDIIQDRTEKKIKKIFAKTGLYQYELIHIKKYMEHSKHFIPWTLTGEPGLSTGASLYHLADKYCGVINIGPFGCMNSRMTEAISTPEMTLSGKIEAAMLAGEKTDLAYLSGNTESFPFLSIESDGNPLSQLLEAKLEIFMLQANRLFHKMKNKSLKK